MSDEHALYARSGNTNGLGKCSEEVKVLAPEETMEALSAMAFHAGKPLSEYVRNILLAHVHGHAALYRLAARGMDPTADIGKE